MMKFLCLTIGGCVAIKWLIDTLIMIGSQL